MKFKPKIPTLLDFYKAKKFNTNLKMLSNYCKTAKIWRHNLQHDKNCVYRILNEQKENTKFTLRNKVRRKICQWSLILSVFKILWKLKNNILKLLQQNIGNSVYSVAHFLGRLHPTNYTCKIRYFLHFLVSFHSIGKNIKKSTFSDLITFLIWWHSLYLWEI